MKQIYHGTLKERRKQAHEKYYKNNKEKVAMRAKKHYGTTGRKHLLKRLYNMTLKQYDQMFEAQNGNCAICGLPELMSRLSVDHNHETGKIRGLLCRRCNSGLGWYESHCQKAIEYLNNK